MIISKVTNVILIFDFVLLQDRASQSRIMDLEAQLSQARTDIARLKREKEEVGYPALSIFPFE